MKLSEYIKHLQNIIDAHGDIHCIHYVGNITRNVTRSPTMVKALAYNNGDNLIFPHEEQYHEYEPEDGIRFDLVKTCLLS